MFSMIKTCAYFVYECNMILQLLYHYITVSETKSSSFHKVNMLWRAVTSTPAEMHLEEAEVVIWNVITLSKKVRPVRPYLL